MADSHSALRGLLIDLDGTLYHGHKMIAGADKLIQMLQDKKVSYLFVTNNSTGTAEVVAERLRSMGIPAKPEDVCTSAQAAAFYIAEQNQGARVFAVGEDGLRSAIMDAGLQLVDENPDIVVQGMNRQLTYDQAARAVSFILNGASYVLTNPDKLLPTADGYIPGAGSISAMLQTATGIAPTVIGKPSAILMNFALKKLGLQAAETWVVGDNPHTDIAAGQIAGCKSVLVLTGLATKQNYKQLLEAACCDADVVLEDLHDLHTYIGDKLASQQ
ncbi:haloacid dehalogenase [Paenibacillus baekrokdamisoli]|uniref:Acid sugar phosphatase n=1 Tax=Paenibacillus baekrokdamisoli TaxID=1712516 RepID=A0A3G9IUZ6_9BACL|nr:TIGR01457 family HAD-type hydrolase [Paenibacillus baekrokdamisoli]MBB3070545.1 4-nitrophenyl phosphatase [Paenibacillus baekrokdamisoli]BBH19895.1 haloacid dehalogenase [Paenibacillus baekrokdamisoli]